MFLDHKPFENFIKGKRENNKDRNWSTELSLYKLHTLYIKGVQNVITDLLSCLVATDLKEWEYKPM